MLVVSFDGGTGFDSPSASSSVGTPTLSRARVESVPAEIEAEEAAIRSWYSDQATRLFPAALTFLVPRRLADSDLCPVLALGGRR